MLLFSSGGVIRFPFRWFSFVFFFNWDIFGTALMRSLSSPERVPLFLHSLSDSRTAPCEEFPISSCSTQCLLDACSARNGVWLDTRPRELCFKTLAPTVKPYSLRTLSVMRKCAPSPPQTARVALADLVLLWSDIFGFVISCRDLLTGVPAFRWWPEFSESDFDSGPPAGRMTNCPAVRSLSPTQMASLNLRQEFSATCLRLRVGSARTALR